MQKQGRGKILREVMEPAALEILNSPFKILKGETGDAGTAQKACVFDTYIHVEPRGTAWNHLGTAYGTAPEPS